MNDPAQQTPTTEPNKGNEAERTKQVTIFGWTAGICAFFAGFTLINAPTWPVAFAVAAMAVMGAFVFSRIFKRG